MTVKRRNRAALAFGIDSQGDRQEHVALRRKAKTVAVRQFVSEVKLKRVET
jgi:hypothetical protein